MWFVRVLGYMRVEVWGLYGVVSPGWGRLVTCFGMRNRAEYRGTSLIRNSPPL